VLPVELQPPLAVPPVEQVRDTAPAVSWLIEKLFPDFDAATIVKPSPFDALTDTEPELAAGADPPALSGSPVTPSDVAPLLVQEA
jgi:hypothetical protein